MKKPKVYNAEKLKQTQERWDAKQNVKDQKDPKNRWARYKDSPLLIEVKKAHQHKYLEDLAAYLNEKNADCAPEERLHIHGWYRRWNNLDESSYFITEAMLRKGRSKEYAAFLGETMVFYEPFKKEEFLEKLRGFLGSFVDKLNWLSDTDFLTRTAEFFESLAKELKETILTTAELDGLFYDLKKLGELISQLIAWMQRLDLLGTPSKVIRKKVQYPTWLEYFLKSGCDLGEFVRDYCKEAGVNTFGRIGSPI